MPRVPNRRTWPRGLPAAAQALAVVAVLAVPSLRVWRAPPPGRWFPASFLYQDDHFQYLSFVEQARRGEWAFANKFDPGPRAPFLVNLGWWSAGRLAAALGVSEEIGWFLWSLFAAALLVLGVRRFLARAGRAGAALAWGTALVVVGGGLGWLRVAGLPRAGDADLTFSFYPWLQLIGGGHGTLGTALLVWGLALWTEWRRGIAPRWPWIAVASVLGLCRPFDFATLVAVTAAVAAAERLRGRPRDGLADLAWLAPVLFYDALAFGLHPSFASWRGGQNVVPLPGAVDLAWALGPALALAVAALAAGAVDGLVRQVLATWTLVVVALLFSRLGFAAQFATSIGAALLLSVAASASGRALPVLALALSPTSLVLYWRVLHPSPEWFPPRDYVRAAHQLAATCAPGDVVYAPAEPSLLVAALTPCHVAFGHRVLTPQFERRAAESEVFYSDATPARWRAGYLERLGARYAMIPAGRGRWMDSTGFLPRWRLPSFEVWESARRQRPGVDPPRR
jgi:hypothetical protein